MTQIFVYVCCMGLKRSRTLHRYVMLGLPGNRQIQLDKLFSNLWLCLQEWFHPGMSFTLRWPSPHPRMTFISVSDHLPVSVYMIWSWKVFFRGWFHLLPGMISSRSSAPRWNHPGMRRRSSRGETHPGMKSLMWTGPLCPCIWDNVMV